MLSVLDLRGSALTPAALRSVLPRAAADVAATLDAVRPICDEVRDRGSAALLDFAERFDGVRPAAIRVPAEVLDKALIDLDPAVRAALEEAARRARLVHSAQKHPDAVVQVSPGGTVTERWIPVRRVGLYVPGGVVAYPSSVVMNVVPAQVAGVSSIAVTSPPQRDNDGWPHPVVLAACALLGVDEVYAVGGAQAIAMFAHGTEDCAPADLVTGPGNVYVAAAKRLLKGIIGIDAEAGPTEIGILADATADPVHVAADLISQAEHDENASCLLITDAPALVEQVQAEVERQRGVSLNQKQVDAALANQSAIVLVDDLEAGLTVVDEWAAEHLEILTADASALARRVRNAGAIFVGPYAPVSLGDYLAGSNHVLPTGGTARHTGGLSVHSFLRSVHVVEYDRAALAEVAGHIDALGGAENLLAHVNAVRVRVPSEQSPREDRDQD
ncbi:histidinol dehydrogenase [Sporichthya polymorpha]|uniref:histidinol dehydrogenase n=1 Tax=Sporichthya polymorpha TaxID=35751 RepID=UPI00039F1FDE|nr:histidinol dehydrogenase [Sporichthya polymorpha]